uniref:tRNA (adenosine(37)-N6)-threonylcarbamoyltransferase complex dimerization subunit type 1 TsaB n=1 Tax=Nesterenkonia sp. F TaxID=795955 RepID=UPI000255D089
MLLAIDSSAGASAAVTDGETVLSHRRTDATTTHAEVLAPAVRDVLTEAGISGARLDGVVVGVGPGPFTGLRV